MKICICDGKSCKDKFINYTEKRLNSDIEKFELKNIFIEKCSCMGNCKSGPNIKIDNEIFNYIDPAKASKLMMERINNR
ncbi:MAG: (2Fe-2S) ferredoxin domain-containing protein [Candidatus Gracilibacteria bacterium]|nr:(2Fe-2S) ferredoxin domain-containing protein [Candidatus Gracilibacteria bacterium]